MTGDTLEAHTETILAAIRDTRHTVETQIAAVVNEVGIIRTSSKN